MKPLVPLLALLISAGGTFAADAQSCAEVDSTTVEVLETVLGVALNTVAPGTRFEGELALSRFYIAQIATALSAQLDIDVDKWDEAPDWDNVQDVIDDARRMTGCDER